MDIEELDPYFQRVRQRWDYIFAYCGFRNVEFYNYTMEDVKKIEELRRDDHKLETLWARLEEAREDYRKAVARYLKERE